MTYTPTITTRVHSVAETKFKIEIYDNVWTLIMTAINKRDNVAHETVLFTYDEQLARSWISMHGCEVEDNTAVREVNDEKAKAVNS